MTSTATTGPAGAVTDSGAAPGKIAFAHALRGWAALVVAISHLAVGFWMVPAAVAGLTHLTAPDPMPPLPAMSRALIAITGAAPGEPSLFSYGPFGVGLFFLISGFVIPFSFRRQSRIGFLAGRVLRLWPTYAAGLTLTLVALWAGGLVVDRPFPYGTDHVLKHYVLGLRDLLWLPSIDGVVWTLEIEVKFYLLCALLAPWLASGRRWVLYAVPALLVLVVYTLGLRYDAWITGRPTAYRLAWVAAVDSQMIIFMLAGTAFNFLHRRLIGRAEALALIAALYGLCAWSGFFGYARAGAAVTACSYGAALALFTICFLLRDRIRGGGVIGWLADISYPLYAVHAVAGYTLMTLLTSRGMSGGTALLCAMAAAIGIAWLIHMLVERPTHLLATRVARALSEKPAESASVAAPAERPFARAA